MKVVKKRMREKLNIRDQFLISNSDHRAEKHGNMSSVTSILLIFCIGFTPVSPSVINILYWDIKPFLYERGNGTHGMLVDMFSYGAVFCLYTLKEFARYTKIAHSHEEFLNKLNSEKSNREIIPQGIAENDTLWAPMIIQENTLNSSVLQRRRLTQVVFHTSKKLVLIVHRRVITLDYKIAMGLLRCQVVLITSVTLSICFGILLWLVERRSNSSMHEDFRRGSAKSIWCMFVSMTTVGYGDITAKTFLGRFLTVCWIAMSLFIIGIITSIITETVQGDSTFNINAQRIAVMRDSVAHRVAGNCMAKIVVTTSYAELYEKVRRREVFGALVLNEVAAADQNMLKDDNHPNPLRLVKEFKVQHPIFMLVPTQPSKETNESLVCMKYQNIYESRSAVNNRHVKLDFIYYTTMMDAIQNVFFQFLVVLLLTLWVVCFVVEYFGIDGKKGGAVDSKVIPYVVKDKSGILNDQMKISNCRL